MIGNEPSNSDEKHEYTIDIKRREQIKNKKLSQCMSLL